MLQFHHLYGGVDNSAYFEGRSQGHEVVHVENNASCGIRAHKMLAGLTVSLLWPPPPVQLHTEGREGLSEDRLGWGLSKELKKGQCKSSWGGAERKPSR